MEKIPRSYKYKKIEDNRGKFFKLVSEINNKKFLKKEKILEINYSNNKKKGTIRGFHYQIGKFQEKKIIFCLSGRILDISININKKSKNYKKIYKFILDGEKNNFLIIPKNYAHGFQTLKNNTNLLYLHTKKYNKKFQKTLNPIKNNFKVKWPLKFSVISNKDLNS